MRGNSSSNNTDHSSLENSENERSSSFFKIGDFDTKDVIKQIGKRARENRDETEEIKIRLTKNEALAIMEYARQCDESVSDLIRKCVIREATLADGYGADDRSYDYSIKFPSQSPYSKRRERKLTEENCNKIRDILGWKKIRL